MFKIVIADGKEELPDDDIYYIVAKEGVFIKKKLGIMDSLSPVKNISILESVKATAKMNIEKIPSISVAKISNFFRAVQEEHRSEAIVLLFYNEKTKKYKLVPPSQKVSPASIEYNRSIVIDGWTMIGDIHSHSSMSAFHSGTDQGDENSFDGLHITFGNMGDEFISISASIVSNGNRVMVKPEEYMKGIELKKEIDEVEEIPTTRIYKWKNGRMVEETPKYSTKSVKTYRKYDKRYKIISENAIKAKVPSSWLDAVEYGFTPYRYYGNAWQNWQGNYQSGRFVNGRWNRPIYRGWNQNFDPSIWPNNKLGQGKDKIPPQNVGVKTKPITFPPHDQGPIVTEVSTPEKPLPCESCAFKEAAMEYVAKILVEERDGSIEDETDYPSWLEREIYECNKCGIIATFEYNDNGEIEDEIICPACKSSDHLILIDEEDLDDSYSYTNINLSPNSDVKDKISCKTCGSVFDSDMLKKDDKGGSCPFCGTLLLVEQYLNYTKENGGYVCKSCSTTFSKDVIEDGCCPFCLESLVKKITKEDIKYINKEEISNYTAEKETPNPCKIIPDPAQEIDRQKTNPLQRMFERFGRKT